MYIAKRIPQRQTWHRNYREIDGGGRLRPDRIMAKAAELREFFDADDDEIAAICEAVKARKTLLIEGGGEPFPLSNRVLRKKAWQVG